MRLTHPNAQRRATVRRVKAELAGAMWMAACANVCGYTKDEARALGLAYARAATREGFLAGRPEADELVFAGRKLRRVIDGFGDLVGFRTAATLVRPAEFAAVREAFGEAEYQAALSATTEKLWRVRIEILDGTTHAWDLFKHRLAGVRSIAVELLR